MNYIKTIQRLYYIPIYHNQNEDVLIISIINI
jgi:hypothetical protein